MSAHRDAHRAAARRAEILEEELEAQRQELDRAREEAEALRRRLSRKGKRAAAREPKALRARFERGPLPERVLSPNGTALIAWMAGPLALCVLGSALAFGAMREFVYVVLVWVIVISVAVAIVRGKLAERLAFTPEALELRGVVPDGRFRPWKAVVFWRVTWEDIGHVAVVRTWYGSRVGIDDRGSGARLFVDGRFLKSDADLVAFILERKSASLAALDGAARAAHE